MAKRKERTLKSFQDLKTLSIVDKDFKAALAVPQEEKTPDFTAEKGSFVSDHRGKIIWVKDDNGKWTLLKKK